MTKIEPKRTIRTNDPAGVRTRLPDAAAGLFQSKGYAGTTMGDIVHSAEVTGGAMYHHYRTKKELTLAVIEERVGPTVRETWIYPVVKAKTVGAGVKGVMDAIIRDLETRGGVRGCPLNNLALELALSDEDFQQAVGLIFQEWQDSLASALKTGLDHKSSRRSREALATLIIASYSGAMAMAKAQQDAAPLRRARDELVRLLTAL